jgi:hypothetical protein
MSDHQTQLRRKTKGELGANHSGWLIPTHPCQQSQWEEIGVLGDYPGLFGIANEKISQRFYHCLQRKLRLRGERGCPAPQIARPRAFGAIM